MKNWFFVLVSVWVGVIGWQSMRFVPTESEISTRKLAKESFGSSYIVTSAYVKLWGGVVERECCFRLPSIILGLIAVCLLYMLNLKDRLWSALFLLISPWFTQMYLFDLQASLSTSLALALFVTLQRKRSYLAILLAIMLVNTSFVGGVLSVVMLGSQLRTNKALFMGIVTLFLLINQKNFVFNTEIFDLSKHKEQVQIRLNEEYLANGRQLVVRERIKRIAYSEYYLVARELFVRVLGIFDFEKMSSPGQEGVSVSRNIWSNKNWQYLYFWQLILIAIALVRENVGKIHWVLILSSVASAIFIKNFDFFQVSLPMLLAFSILAAAGFGSFAKKMQLVLFVPIILGILTTYHFFLTKELYWRDNRPWVQYQMAERLLDLGPSSYSSAQITTLVGNSKLYWDWIGGSGNVSFGQFDLADKRPLEANKVWIGFPGEFLGSKKKLDRNDFNSSELPGNLKIIDKFSFKDSISYGMGDEIWIVRSQ